MNQRRAELIHRKVRGSLSEQEERELTQLQQLSLEAVERAYPRPVVDLAGLLELEEQLKKQGASEAP